MKTVLELVYASIQTVAIVAGTLLVFALLIARAYIVPAFVVFLVLTMMGVDFGTSMFTAASFATALCAADIYRSETKAEA